MNTGEVLAMNRTISTRILTIIQRVGIIDDIFGILNSEGKIRDYISSDKLSLIDTFDDIVFNITWMFGGSYLKAREYLYRKNDDHPFCGMSPIELIINNPSSCYEINFYLNALIAPYMQAMDICHEEEYFYNSLGADISIYTHHAANDETSLIYMFQSRANRIIAKKLSYLEHDLNIPINTNKKESDINWECEVNLVHDDPRSILQKTIDGCDQIINTLSHMYCNDFKFSIHSIHLNIFKDGRSGKLTAVLTKE